MEENVQTKKVRLDLDIDTTVNKNNYYQKIIDLAIAIDAWRIFPRAFITVYIFLLYEVTIWFMQLSEPTTQQASLLSVMTGVGAAWFGLYTKTKGDGN